MNTKTLRLHVDSYVNLRQRLGFKMRQHRSRLYEYVDFLSTKNIDHVTVASAIDFSTSTGATTGAVWFRLHAIRDFARHMIGRDPRTQIPPRGLVPSGMRRKEPYLLSGQELKRFMMAAREVPHAACEYQTAYWYTLFGLLAVTGMRPGEAIRLERECTDLDRGVLRIRKTKGENERLVPLHMTTVKALKKFAQVRDFRFPELRSPYFFVSPYSGRRISATYATVVFKRLLNKSGVLEGGLPAGKDWPTPMSFRHRFVTVNFARIKRAGLDPEVWCRLLSTYVGHKNFTDTFWYLENAIELRSQARAKLDAVWA